MAKKQRSQGGHDEKQTNCGTYQLDVKFVGTFVFALRADDPTNTDLVTGIDVYAPACGHMYSAGIDGAWNNPFQDPSKPGDSSGLLMLETRRHCLEISPNACGGFSISALRKSIGKANLWPSGSRTVMQGWDLVLRIPAPADAMAWATESVPVGKCFKGADSSLFNKMGMSQTLSYYNVTTFNLKGSPLPIHQPDGSDPLVTFVVNAEPACVPSLEHQRHSAEALARVVGLDLTLEKPIQMVASKLLNAKTGSCMGSAIVSS